ncbi:hypothetical protein [Roseinatronobacter sp.]
MKIVTDLSVTPAPHRARHGWHPGWLFRSGAQGAWFDPSDLTTLFQDVAGTVPVVADGDPVALMLDKSGNANHAFQPTAAARPTWRTDGQLAWLEYDGVDDRLFIPPIGYSGPVSVCIGLQRFGSTRWGSFRSANLASPEFHVAGSSHPTDQGMSTNSMSGTDRLNGQVFTGGRVGLYNALQTPSVGTSLNNSSPIFHREGTFFAYAQFMPSGRVFSYVECEGSSFIDLPFLERWVAGKTGVTL